jgi:hypothetical protein
MSLAGDYYVDSTKANDSGDGLSWGNAKQHLSAALALIDEELTADVTIHLKSGSSQPAYTGDCSLAGIRAAVGSSAKLFIERDVFYLANYNAGGDPFTAPTGTTIPPWVDVATADFQLDLQLQITFEDCHVVGLRGLAFSPNSSGEALTLLPPTMVTAQYCRFNGPIIGAVVMYDALFTAENCYFQGNQLAAFAIYGGKVHLIGDTTIKDPVLGGGARVGEFAARGVRV